MGLWGLWFPCAGAAAATAILPLDVQREKALVAPNTHGHTAELRGLQTRERAPVGSPVGVAVARDCQLGTRGADSRH